MIVKKDFHSRIERVKSYAKETTHENIHYFSTS